MRNPFMDNLDKELRRLSKIEPSKGFIEVSRSRLMARIELEKHEHWFMNFLRRFGKGEASESFFAQARTRLMARITQLPQPIRIPLRGFTLFLSYTKKAVASTLVMAMAVTATLFVVEGRTTVEASDTSYLEITAGSASIKHPDLLTWEAVNGPIQIKAGDLIKVDKRSEAVVHFFDDTELRLGENTQFLISQLAVSPAFGGQGVIEGSLHEGSVWVQTLNVEDGYAGFTLYTPDAVFKAVDATFDVTAKLNTPTSVLVLDNKLEMSPIRPETREELGSYKLLADQKATVHFSHAAIVTTASVSKQDVASPWVQENLTKDSEHLTILREKGLERLTEMAGTLPGQMLYPIKQAKERLQLAFSSNSDLDLQIEIANRRLNEALVLLEMGDRQKGQEALQAYQDIARQIASAKEAGQVSNKLAEKLLIPHQKILIAELPNDASTGLVKEALNQTAEILADNPVDFQKVRLTNSVQKLQDISALIEQGDLNTAKSLLVSQQLNDDNALKVAESITDPTLKKSTLQDILDLRKEELVLLTTLSGKLVTEYPGSELTNMIMAASEAAARNVEVTLAAAAPLLPELQEAAAPPQPGAGESQMNDMLAKINLYKTWGGQQNQIDRLLKNDFKNPSSLNDLISLRNHLQGRAYDYLNIRILQLERLADIQKGKAMERKIERNQRLRDN